MERVKEQYERFPYPPVPALALPRRDQGQGLRYECAVALAHAAGLAAIEPLGHGGLRILVAGAGTLEPLVVAQQHPEAVEIVAVDLSRASLRRLQQRLTLARLLRGRRPPLRLVEGDISHWQDGQFDYILASNVLHHTADPAATLAHLAAMLRPGGVMRIVTYARMSRYWINRCSEWLRWHGLDADTPQLRQRTASVIGQLPADHPIRSCYRAHGETATVTGLVDAFFHSHELPLAPLQWQQASEAAGLEWLGETQSELAQGRFLQELWPPAGQLSGWQRLQLMDDLLELSSSPILWFRKREGVELRRESQAAEPATDAIAIDIFESPWFLPSRIYWELGRGLRRADAMLCSIDGGVVPLLERLRQEIGPRLGRDGLSLPGLTLGEYPVTELLQAPRPPESGEWRQLDELAGRGFIEFRGAPLPGETPARQLQWLQLRHGHEQGALGPLFTKVY